MVPSARPLYLEYLDRGLDKTGMKIVSYHQLM